MVPIRMPVLGGCALLLLALAQTPALADEGLATTSPQHYREGPQPSLLPFPVKRMRQLRTRELPSSIVLYREPDRRISEMRRDPLLSDQCRAGVLHQYRDRQFIVHLGGYSYGAGVGGHWSLVDREGAAAPGRVYAFRHQNSGRCEVYRIERASAF